MSTDSEAVVLEKIKAATEIVKNIRDKVRKTPLEIQAEQYLSGQFGQPVAHSVPSKSEIQQAAEMGFAGALKAEE